MKHEIVLEKYAKKPILIKTNNDNMLDCNGVTVAEKVLQYDAVTDITGAIHGVLLNSDGQILYFRLTDGLPVSKSIASGVSQQSLKNLSITELDGILHILIVKCEKNFTVHHYRTQGNAWVRSYPKNMDASTLYVDSCPCCLGKFALLVKNNGKESLYLQSLGKWQLLQHTPLPEDYIDISMSYYDGNIEILTHSNAKGVQSSVLVAIDTPKAEDGVFAIKEISRNMEDNMANGSIINSKYVSQLQENSAEIESLKEQLTQLKTSLDNIYKTLEIAEKQYKYITMCRDAVKQHDTQINQINIKIQELTNRFNAFAKQRA